MHYDLRIIALGAGVQSTTMYRMAALGEIDGPRPDVAIFADTQQEPPWVYENLEQLDRDHGHVIPIERATRGDLGAAIREGMNSTGGRFASVPFWVESVEGRGAPGRRQCTREYKIDAIKQRTRELLGLRYRQHASGRYRVEEWVGISVDEAQRAKPSRYDWIDTRWPLLDLRLRRRDCLRWLEGRGLPIPEKSACVFCPYRSPVEWARWRDDHPEQFEEACRWDEAIREKGSLRGMNGQQFILRSLHSLRDLPSREDLEGRDDAQLDLFGNECEGMCGV